MKKTNIHSDPIKAAVAVTVMLLALMTYYANDLDKALGIERPSFITAFLATILFSIIVLIIASRIYKKRENWIRLGVKIHRYCQFYIRRLKKA